MRSCRESLGNRGCEGLWGTPLPPEYQTTSGAGVFSVAPRAVVLTSAPARRGRTFVPLLAASGGVTLRAVSHRSKVSSMAGRHEVQLLELMGRGWRAALDMNRPPSALSK